MFLETVIKRNHHLIAFAQVAFANNLLLPNTYILDLDTIIDNTKKIKVEANKYGIELYQMTKQFGRNPLVAQAIAKAGIEKAVCVDFDEALILAKNNIQIGNVGHIVQIPNNLIRRFLKLKPQVITVFGLEKAKQIDIEARRLHVHQDIILKVYDDNDVIYSGQKGGLHLKTLKGELKEIQKLKNLKMIGFTTFPAFLFNGHRTQKTNNLNTIKQAIKIAATLGIKSTHINLPSANSVKTMSLIAKSGGTHGEPGHALIGTMVDNAKGKMVEVPAIIYVSEISHITNNHAYFYGGGHYRRGNFSNILVGNAKTMHKFTINTFDPYAIDYYLNFTIKDQKVKVGDLVIGAFRTQIFVTRAKVMVVQGLRTNQPQIAGVFSAQGEKLKWI